MTKLEVQSRISKNGKKLALDKFSWDEKTRTFVSEEDNLVLDFRGVVSITFKTGWDCIFVTGSYCTFKTDSDCIFETGDSCTFDTGSDCTFVTGSDCTFETYWNCTFKTGGYCTFDTGSYCTFKTYWNCTFKIGENCIINSYYSAYIINRNKNNLAIIRNEYDKTIYDLDTLNKDKVLKLSIDYIIENEIEGK